MSSPDDLAARGRAIFDRLRTDSSPDGTEPETGGPQPEDLFVPPGAPSPGDDEVTPITEDVAVAEEPSFAALVGAPASPSPEAPDAEAEPAAVHVDVAAPLGREAPREHGSIEPDDAPPAASPEAVASDGPVLEADGEAAAVDGSKAHVTLPDGPVTTPVEVDVPVVEAGDGYAAAQETPSDRVSPGDDGGDDGGDDEVAAAAVLASAAPVEVLAPRRPLPRILAVANQKGGVGKTTTAVNLSAALAELGYRVLVVDLDPQGNATTGLGVNARNLDATIYDVLMRDLPLEDAIEATSVRNLFVVPATIDLAGAEIELVPAFSRELKLKRALASVGDDFDYTLIDCPPSLGLLTVNALAAANEVVVPIQCEYYALEGLGQLLRNVQLVRGNLNPALELSTIILTMYDARTRLAEQVANEVREHFGRVVCRHIVPRTVRLSEAPSFGQPIIAFDPTSRGAIAYRELAKEVSGGAPQRIG